MAKYNDAKYGMSRVLEPKYVLPTSAWRLDNNRAINQREMRILIKKIHLEGTNFKQLLLECGENDEKLKEKIMDIVIKRGKLHNPVTDTAGVVYGTVDAVGPEYDSGQLLMVGEEVICNVSLASIPIHIERITEIDRVYSQIDVEGYAILYKEVPVIRVPKELPIHLLLYTLDQSGTLMRASECAVGKRDILLVGSNILVNLLYGFAVRKAAGPEANIICLLDKRMHIHAEDGALEALITEVFNEIHYVDILRPIECMKGFGSDSLFDLSINCADIPGAETINILATKPWGTIIFATLINNYNISLYITETSQKQLDLRCAEGFLEGYEDFDIELVKELAPYFEDAKITVERHGAGKEEYRAAKESGIIDSIAQTNSLAEDFICESSAMRSVLEEVTSVSKYDCNVFISGDTGVGKEKVANIIQKNSVRKMQPYIKVNCAAISPSLIESEFFGYEKGSFTGASSSGKKGYFEAADNGTIFLDEVGELPLDIQAKLLRVMQEGEFFRVGGTTPVKTNVRILSATNRDLEKMVEEKTFRRDLYYRLNVFPIRIPSLNERKADIPALVKHFVGKYGEQYGIHRDISDDALEYLTQQDWKGNIRELENVMQRLLIGAKGETILLFDVTKELNQELFNKGGGNSAMHEPVKTQGVELDLTRLLESYEKGIIQYACEKYGSTRKAAKAIGISQTQLVRKKNKYFPETTADLGRNMDSWNRDMTLVNGRWERVKNPGKDKI